MKILPLYNTLFVLILVVPRFASIDVADQAIFHTNELIEDSKTIVSLCVCTILLLILVVRRFRFIWFDFASLVNKSVFECTCYGWRNFLSTFNTKRPVYDYLLVPTKHAFTVHVYKNCQAHQWCFFCIISFVHYRPASSFPLAIRQWFHLFGVRQVSPSVAASTGNADAMTAASSSNRRASTTSLMNGSSRKQSSPLPKKDLSGVSECKYKK